MTLTLKIASNGEISGFRYHDGAIVRISFEANRAIELGIASVDGDVTHLMLNGVKYFITNNLREGNTVDRIFLWDMRSAPAWLHQRMSDVLEAPLNSLPNVVGSRIFYLQCSFGAELLAVVDSVAISDK